jgi:hypothetical protein
MLHYWFMTKVGLRIYQAENYEVASTAFKQDHPDEEVLCVGADYESETIAEHLGHYMIRV